MANAVVEIVAPSGMTLTLSLFPIGSDAAAASGKTLTERTNDKGTYRGTVTEGLTGLHRAVALSGAVAVSKGVVLMDDTATDHYVRGDADMQALKGQPITCAAAVTFRADVGAAAAPGDANGMLIGGNNAATTFASLTSTGAFTISDGIIVTCSTPDRTAVSFTGNGSGAGMSVVGGLTGTGLYIDGAAYGLYLAGTSGLYIAGTVDTTGTATFAALTVTGALTAGSNAIPWNAAWDAEVQSECDDALDAFTADTGITLSKSLEILAAYVCGKISVSSAGGVSTYTYLKRDGAATSFTAACSETDGTRATTGSLT